MPEQELEQYIANEIGQKRLVAFEGGRGHAESLLFKRSPFFHEEEARLIYVENGEKAPSSSFLLPIEPEKLVDEIVLDPRLSVDEERERQEGLRQTGYQGVIRKSQLYQKKLWMVRIQ